MGQLFIIKGIKLKLLTLLVLETRLLVQSLINFKYRIKDITSLFKGKGEEILKFSNLVAAKVTTKYGAIESIPSLEEVIEEL